MEGGKAGGVFASECGEVFTKQDLTTERQKTSKVIGRPKRKERRCKAGSQMSSQDIMRKIKLSSEIVSSGLAYFTFESTTQRYSYMHPIRRTLKP